MIYNISKRYFMELSAVKNHRGEIVGWMSEREVMQYLNRTAGILRPITGLQID